MFAGKIVVLSYAVCTTWVCSLPLFDFNIILYELAVKLAVISKSPVVPFKITPLTTLSPVHPVNVYPVFVASFKVISSSTVYVPTFVAIPLFKFKLFV